MFSIASARLGPALAYAAFAVAAIAILVGMDPLYEPPSGALRFEPSIAVQFPDGAKVDAELTWHRCVNSPLVFSPGRYVETLSLAAPRAAIDASAEYSLVLPSVEGNGLSVRWNGEFVGGQGDVVEGRSNIWNSVKVFALAPGQLRPENIVSVEIFGHYEAGLIKPPYVMKRAGNEGFLLVLELLSERLIWALCGGIGIIGLTLLFIGLPALPRIDSRFLLGLASILTALFMADFLTLEVLPIPLIAFKRVVVVLRHAAAALFILGYLKLLGRRVDLFAKIIIAAQLAAIVVLFFPDSMIALKRAYSLTYLTIIPFPFYLLILLFITRKGGLGRFLLSGGVGIGLLSASRDTIAGLFFPGSVMVSHYGFMFMVVSTTGFVGFDIMQSYRQLKVERNRADRYKEESLHDPLTGAFNRGVIPLVREGLRGPFAVMTLDLDHFKEINDRYGHRAGDRVLLDVVSVMHRVFRRDDWVVRSGGDEFQVFLPDCPERRLEVLSKALAAELSMSRIAISESETISYSASIGSAFSAVPGQPASHFLQSLLEAADADMYAHKGDASI